MAGGRPVQADVQRPEDGKTARMPRTPIARPVRVDAVRGEPMIIMLEGLTSSTKSLEFIIRKQPRLGKLEGAPVTQGQIRGAVRYVADPSLKGAVDTFSYAVKFEGSSSSEEAVVTVNIVDPAPVLDVSGGGDIGSLLAGAVSEQNITVRNSGNATFRSTVPLPAGWSWGVPAGGKFEVAPGTTLNATVNIRMSQATEIDEKIVFAGAPPVRFSGHSVAPMQGIPSMLQMTWDPGKRQRSATLQVANNGPAPITVRLSGPPELTLPAELPVASLEKKAVVVVLGGKLDQAASGSIKLDSPGWSQEVSWKALPAPALVTIAEVGEDGLVDFGTLDMAGLKTASRKLTLHNAGGTVAAISWKAPKFFDISGIPTESVLPPGQDAVLTIQPKADVSGSLKDDWTLGATGGDHNLKLHAELDPEAMKKAMMSGMALKPIPQEGTVIPLEASGDDKKEIISVLYGGVVPVNNNTDKSLPKISTVRLVDEAPDRLVFEWQAPGEGAWSYRVLSMRLSKIPNSPFPIKDWDVMDNVKVTATATGGRAEVTRLIPDARWVCRVVAVRGDGKETEPGPMLTFITPSEKPARWPWIVLGVVLTGLLFYWLRRKWREDIKWQAS